MKCSYLIHVVTVDIELEAFAFRGLRKVVGGPNGPFGKNSPFNPFQSMGKVVYNFTIYLGMSLYIKQRGK